MNKIFIIIKREYISRVRRRAFVISTFLFPIFIILIITGSVFLAAKSTEKLRIAVSDEQFSHSLKSDSSSAIFEYNPTVDQKNFDDKGYSAYLKLHSADLADGVDSIVTRKSLGLETMSDIRNQIRKAYENKMLEQKGISRTTLDSVLNVISSYPNAQQQIVNSEGQVKEAHEGLAYGIGFG